MPGKNVGICHSCREPGHYLPKCPNLKKCPECHDGFVTWMEVEENKNGNRGRFFFGCSVQKCKYFVWCDEIQHGGATRSTSVATSSSSGATSSSIEDLTRLFRSAARIAEEEGVEISFQLTIRKGNIKDEGDDKGKGKAQQT